MMRWRRPRPNLAKTYMELDVVMDETFVDTASLQYLILRCKERGIEAQGETAAIIQGTFTPAYVGADRRYAIQLRRHQLRHY